MSRFVALLIVCGFGLGVTACGGSGSSSGGAPASSPGTSNSSPSAGDGGSTDLSSIVDLSAVSSLPLTMKAPSGSTAITDAAGAGVLVHQVSGGNFAAEIDPTTTSFAVVRGEFRAIKAPFAFVKFTVDEPNALIYEQHVTDGGQDTDSYSAYYEPTSPSGYFCASESGSTHTEAEAQAVLAACKTLAAK
jgi:hypothetical protein